MLDAIAAICERQPPQAVAAAVNVYTIEVARRHHMHTQFSTTNEVNKFIFCFYKSIRHGCQKGGQGGQIPLPQDFEILSKKRFS